MFDKLFPQPIDNRYSASKIALWLFGLIVFVHILQSVMVFVSGPMVAQSADGIPLENYPAAAAQTILAIFMVSSLRRLIISLICAVVLFRYRSAVPLMFVVLGLSYLGGQVIFQFVPIVRVGTPPGVVMNLTMFGLTIVGLALSLWRRDGSHPVDGRARAT
ncbi:MAG TPA: hypothetical protein VK582_24175 [Pyrinomonadaceae bacterium]|nr:hypothetical protein [Pyrinomonadaceae bacterium]